MLWLKTNQKAALPTHRLFKECRKTQCPQGMGTDIQRLSKTKKDTLHELFFSPLTRISDMSQGNLSVRPAMLVWSAAVLGCYSGAVVACRRQEIETPPTPRSSHSSDDDEEDENEKAEIDEARVDM